MYFIKIITVLLSESREIHSYCMNIQERKEKKILLEQTPLIWITQSKQTHWHNISLWWPVSIITQNGDIIPHTTGAARRHTWGDRKVASLVMLGWLVTWSEFVLMLQSTFVGYVISTWITFASLTQQINIIKLWCSVLMDGKLVSYWIVITYRPMNSFSEISNVGINYVFYVCS